MTTQGHSAPLAEQAAAQANIHDPKTMDAPKGFPNTEALSPAGLKQADIAVVTAPPAPVASPVQQALKALAAAQREQEDATRAEGAARLAHVEAQRRSGRAEQLVAAAHKGYDLALQQSRRAGIDPAERRDAV